MNLNALVGAVDETLEEYAQDGLAWDEDDLRDVLDRLALDWAEVRRFLV